MNMSDAHLAARKMHVESSLRSQVSRDIAADLHDSVARSIRRVQSSNEMLARSDELIARLLGWDLASSGSASPAEGLPESFSAG
jgi:hypothetical protein